MTDDDKLDLLIAAIKHEEAPGLAALVEKIRTENKRLRATLDYVWERTYCGADAEWHFKQGYDPQVVIDALKDTSLNETGE